MQKHSVYLKSVLKTSFSRILRMSNTFSKSKLGLINVLTVIIVTPLTYAVLLYFVEQNTFTKLDILPQDLKELLSINNWWLDSLISLSVPLFLSAALSVQLAVLKPEHADVIRTAIPWIPKVRGIFHSQVAWFFIFSASVLSGTVLLLTFGGEEVNLRALGLMMFPALILYVAFTIRELLSSNPSKGKLGQKILAKHKLGIAIFLALAGIAFLYSSVYQPIYFRWQVLEFVKSLNLV